MALHTSRLIRLGLSIVLCAGIVTVTSAQSSQHPIRYTAAATNLDPSVALKATLVDFTVTRWSTDAERDRLLAVLQDKGQEKLLETLQKLPRAGTIKTPDSQSYDLQYARRIPGDDGGERVILVTDRPIQFWENWTGSRTLEYPFMIIELRLNAQGRGEGKLTVATKLYVDKSGQVVLENYGSEPVRLSDVKREKG